MSASCSTPRRGLGAAWRRWLPLALLVAVCFPMAAQEGCAVALRAEHRTEMQQAIALYDARRYREAAQALRRLAQKNPRCAEPLFWLGLCSVADGYKAAGIRRYFTRCLELCPDYPDARAHFYMGIIHYTDERYDEAVAALERYFAQANNTDRTDYTALYEEASNYLYWSQFLAEALRNQAPFNPHRVAGASSRHDESFPYLTHDGNTFYYLRLLPTKKPPTFHAREMDQPVWQLCSSPRADTAFGRGAPLPAPFNQGVPEGSVSLTADGSELYYSRITPNGGYSNSDLYVVRRDAQGRWAEPERLSPLINGDRTWESQPSVSPDGRVLLFASNRKGGQGGIDLWRCHRLPNGDWSRPENLGPSVNTPGNEKAPFLAADGHTLFFLSDGWQGFGGYDNYFTDLADRHGNRPTNLGLPINTEGDEMGLGVTADGRQAYFGGRLAGGGSTDVLMFDLYPQARPEAMTCVSVATAATDDDSLSLTLHREGLHDARYRARHGRLVAMLPAEGESLVTIASGRYVLIDYATPATIASLFNSQFQNPSDTVSTSIGFTAEGALTPRTRRLLDAWAAWLVAHPRVAATVQCQRAAQAHTVRDYLVSHTKLRPERVSASGGTAVGKPRIILR